MVDPLLADGLHRRRECAKVESVEKLDAEDFSFDVVSTTDPNPRRQEGGSRGEGPRKSHPGAARRSQSPLGRRQGGGCLVEANESGRRGALGRRATPLAFGGRSRLWPVPGSA